MALKRHWDRAVIGSAHGRRSPGARRIARALLPLAIAAFASAGANAADPRDPVTVGTGIKVQDPVRDLTQQRRTLTKSKGGIFGGSPKKIDQAAPLYLQGDELTYDTRNNRVVATGNVEIYFNNYILTAERVVYDQGAQTLTAEGNAQLKEPNGNIVRADKLVTTDDFRDAFVQSLSVVAKDDTRIIARRAVRRDGNVTEFEQGKFSPCKTDGTMPPLWCVSAARIVHDQAAGNITYEDAKFELFGVPIFYLPYFAHADPSVKRRSGFLMPEYRHSTSLGFTFEAPYFFALAPNYDFTFHPQFTSTHGVLWQGEWRHKIAWGDIRGTYNLKVAGIDQDASTLPDHIPAARRNELDGWRGSVESKGLFSLSSWWRFGWDVTLESDDSFRRFYKLDSVLQTDRVNTIFLQGISDRNYFATTFYHFGGLLPDDTSQARSQVHPVIDYNYIFGQPVLGGELGFSANALALTRPSGADMSRASFQGQWRRKVVDGLGQVWTPHLQVRGDVTAFRNGFDPDLATPIPDDTVTRATALAALTYSYPFVAHAPGGSHIVEPIGQVVARPAYIQQKRLPDEDAKSLVWDDTLLFDVDKFSGWDRVETGTRANVGMQYTFQAAGGGHARFIAGQSFQLAGNNAYADPGYGVDGGNIFNPVSGLESTRSDYVLGAYLAPLSNFRLVSQARFDERDLSLRRQDLFTSIIAGPLTANAQYTYTRLSPELPPFQSEQELQFGGALRLTDRWSLLGGIRYDIDAAARLQDTIQLRYADDCFVLTASYTESFITNPELDIKPDRSVMLRFEFKHLGDLNFRSNVTGGVLTENQPAN